MTARDTIDVVFEDDLTSSQRLQQIGLNMAEFAAWLGQTTRGYDWRGDDATKLREQIVKELDERFEVPVGGVFRECLNRYFITEIVHYLVSAERLPAIQIFISNDCQKWLRARMFKARFDWEHR